jgi:hypothetical protein
MGTKIFCSAPCGNRARFSGLKDQCPNHVDEERMEPASGIGPLPLVYDTSAPPWSYTGTEPTKGSRTLDHPFTKRGLHLARRRSSRTWNRTRDGPVNSRGSVPTLRLRECWGGPHGPPLFFFDEQERLPSASRVRRAAPKSCQVFKGRSSS